MRSNFLLSHKKALKSLKKVLKIDKQIIYTSIFESFLTGIYPYLSLFLVNIVIDSLIYKKFDNLPKNVIFLLLLIFLTGILIDFLKSINDYKTKNIHKKFIYMISEKAMTIDYEEMEKGDFLQKLSDARYVIEHLGGYDIFINYYISILSKIVVIISSFFMIIKMCFTKSINHDIGRFSIISNPYILLSIILSFMLLNIFLSRLISKKSKMRTAEGYQNKMKVERRLNYYVDKVFSNVNFGKDIRIFQMQDYILSLYEDTLNASISFYNKFYHETIKNKESLNKIIMFIAQLSAYTLIIFKVYFKSISIGTMSRYIGVLYMFNNSINELIDINQKISLQSSFIEVFDELLNLPNKKESGNRKISSIKNNRYIIEFHNVSYRYENSKDFALKNISYSFRFNSKFGIVGKNGSGKTTLIKLLTRLYDPTEGYITLNGIDIRQFKYEDYLSLFSIVFQDYQLFAFPISVNISANLHPNIEKVRFAISEVGLSDKVDKLANKENTSLFKMEKDGINFSAGELQKLAIARAIYKDSPIAIFDEPTAALDPESEYEIFKNMSQLINRRAGVFISHRMGSCRFCDNILVLDKGRIVQIGSHEELLKDRSKLYYKLYSTQANHYIE